MATFNSYVSLPEGIPFLAESHDGLDDHSPSHLWPHCYNDGAKGPDSSGTVGDWSLIKNGGLGPLTTENPLQIMLDSGSTSSRIPTLNHSISTSSPRRLGRVWPSWGSSIVTSMPILRMKKMGLEPQILWSCSSWPCWPWLSWTTHPQKWMRCVTMIR